MMRKLRFDPTRRVRLGLASVVAALVLATPLQAQTDPAATARVAAQKLAAAAGALEQADSARDQIGALTDTIRAYEDGLVVLRASLRAAALREREIRDGFEAQRDKLSRLLAVLVSIESAPAPVLMLHPGGPLGTAQAGAMLSDVAPALEAELRGVRAQLDEVAALREMRAGAVEMLDKGLEGAQAARTALNRALAARTELPRRFSADRAALQRLLDGAETLEAFAQGLGAVAGDTVLPTLPDFERALGQLPMPANGTVLRRFGEADAAGIRRPGLVLATRPRALVTAPWSATLRYRGPLLDYGNVVILEVGRDHLMIFAGLGEVYGEIGEILPAGAPVGLMPGNAPDVQSILTELADGGGARQTETLYIELREGGEPVDPAAWFPQDKN